MKYTPLHMHSDYSFLSSAMDCEKIAKVCKERGFTSCAITEHGSASSFMEFYDACTSNKIKPILGIEAYVCEMEGSIKNETNRDLSYLCILSKNLFGAKALFKAVSESNRNAYGKPRLSLSEWASFACNNWIVYSGHQKSTLFNAVCKDGKVHNDALQRAIESIENHQYLFGKDNFFVSIELVDKDNSEYMSTVADILRQAAKRMGAKCIAVDNPHYVDEDDASDQRVLLCASLKTTLSKVKGSLHKNEANDLNMGAFFSSSNYYIHTYEKMLENHAGYEDEVHNTSLIADMCESYSLKNNPIQPIFDKNIDAYEEIAERARRGWRELLNWPKESPQYEEYGNRIRHELDVIKNNGLSNYFLIVADICDYARANNILMGPGRGSGAGCLISYLIGITQIDPLKHGLLFERFFNAARKNSLPDIDLDFPPSRREEILEYIKNKFGDKCVAKIATFSRLQGKAILKKVLTVHEACDFATENAMTEFIPDESKISDDLQEMYEEDADSAKILQWAIINNAKELSPWVKLEKDGTYSGEFGKYFAQAVRLEGLYNNISEHASGVIVTPDEIDNYCPLVDNGKHKLLAGMPYPLLESMGLCKFDILGVSAYDKLAMIINAMETGDIYGNIGDCDEENQPSDYQENNDDN